MAQVAIRASPDRRAGTGQAGERPVTFAAAALVLVAAAAIASYLPARRASRTDAVRALQQE